MMVLILFMGTHSAFVRVSQLLFLMGFDSTFQIMMPLLNLSKPLERNSRYVDAIITIPKGTFFPMCGMNLAFDCELIGPTVYFSLMGDGHPIGHYDNMWQDGAPREMEYIGSEEVKKNHETNRDREDRSRVAILAMANLAVLTLLLMSTWHNISIGHMCPRPRIRCKAMVGTDVPCSCPG